MQKLHYLQGWLPWCRDSVLVAFMPLVAALNLAVLQRPEAMQRWIAQVRTELLAVVGLCVLGLALRNFHIAFWRYAALLGLDRHRRAG